MKFHLPLAALLALAPVLVADDLQHLETQLRDHLVGSPEAADLMLRLLEEREKSEDVFGVIRTAGDFVRAQTNHPRRAELMVRLIEGYVASARHDEVISHGRQFLELFAGDKHAPRARVAMAEAYEKLGRSHEAATQWAALALSGGNPVHAKRALDGFDQAGNAQAAREGAESALALLRGKSQEPWSADAARKGMELAARAEQAETGAAIGRLIAPAKSPRSIDLQRWLWFRLGDFESRLGRHQEAAAAFSQTLSSANPEIWQAVLRELRAADAGWETLVSRLRDMAKALPGNPDSVAQVATGLCDHAFAKENPAAAATLAEEMIRAGIISRELTERYLRACGDNQGRAASTLAGQLGKHPDRDAALLEVLAVDIHQHRTKDANASREFAREWLKRSNSPWGADRIVACLLSQAPDEATAQADLRLIAECAKRTAHIDSFSQELAKWPGDEGERRKWMEAVRRDGERSEETRRWIRARRGGPEGARACEDLLNQSPGADQRAWLLRRLAYLDRHELGEKGRKQAPGRFRDYCKLRPEDVRAAEAWLEAAAQVGGEAKLEAARYLISLKPYPAHPDVRVGVIDAGDAAHKRQTLPWITACARLSDRPFAHAGHIGKLLWDADLKPEARQWWQQNYQSAPDDPEAVDCLLREASVLEGDASVALLRKAWEKSPAVHGPLAMSLANQAFRNQLWDDFEKWLSETRRRADEQPFAPWNVGEWPARGWLDHTSKSAEMDDATKSRVFQAITRLRIDRVSPEAGAWWASLREPSWQRVLDTQAAIRLAPRHHESWERLYPRASSSILRRDMTLAAAILNGMIHSIGGVDEKEIDKARARLRTAYARMGSLGSNIPEDSPIAPLLEVVLNLRLGEEDLAEQSYFKHRALFDKHIEELPVELVLFAAQIHIDLGSEADHQRAEDTLRGWLIRNGESDQVSARDKARIQLLLARNSLGAQSYDVARAEFTTLINLYPKEAEVVEAKFGIGETYMAQGIDDQAEELFTQLAILPDPMVSIRADFMRGLLAIRRDDPDLARTIFLGVLEKVPAIELADSTLYHLAEVYGIEQRYLAQLETLRTVGRLGRESQRWLTPGKALSVVVQDPDLGISRGDTNLPVRVRTEPGGDVEDAQLLSGGAGRGIFLTDIPSVLGKAVPHDGLLQVTGGDLIHVDYPDEFKEQFKNQILEGSRIRIATDGSLEVASQKIENEEDPTFTDTLREQEEEAIQTLAEQRPTNQVKPGNLIHLRIDDGDQDRSPQPDQIAVKLATSSGDVVRVDVTESSAHGGIFVGTIRTGELPAGAQASDTALDHSPLMAIDQRRETSWRSELDGKGPKSLTIDMKQPRTVERITLETPDAEREVPKSMTLQGSQDGRFWFTLARQPSEPATVLPVAAPGMQLRVWQAPKEKLGKSITWDEIVRTIQAGDPQVSQAVENLTWQPPAEGDQVHLVVWTGTFVQPRGGAVRFEVGGQLTAVQFGGRMILPVGQGGRTADVHARRGIHQLAIASLVPSGESPAYAFRARENRRSAEVVAAPFTATDFNDPDLRDLAQIPPSPEPSIARNDRSWTWEMPPLDLRHLVWTFEEFEGAGLAVNHIEIRGGGAQHIPTSADVLELASNDTLELAPGDTVTISYLDEIGADGAHRNRLLTRELTATYGDGKIVPIAQTFSRSANGAVTGQRHELLRIEPGERIVAEITDYDLDSTIERDQVPMEVEAPDGSRRTLTATETGPTTGVFVVEIETRTLDGNGKEEPAIAVAPGDTVVLRYRDDQNNFPGHAYVRESIVRVNQPTDGSIHVLSSGALPGSAPSILAERKQPAEVTFALPLTVEVIDPDRAMHTGSTVEVEVESTQGTRARVECVLSSDYGTAAAGNDSSHPALEAGRFVGQVPLQLGGLQSATVVANLPAKGGIGRILLEKSEEPGSGTRVLNVTGADAITARYTDDRRAGSESSPLESRAVFRSAGSLAVLDESYEEPVRSVFLGKRLYLQVVDPDLDISDGRDIALVRVVSASGEDKTVELGETLNHSGIFNASFPLVAVEKPTQGNPERGIECFFGDSLTVGYLDNVMQQPDGTPVIEIPVSVAMGTDGAALAFSKDFRNEKLAIQTQFHIAESHFELFKSHRKLDRQDEAMKELEAGRRVLRELRTDFPEPEHAPRVQYLLGQFAQELADWDEAVAAYRTVVRNHPQHPLAPESLYKMGQCHEEAGQLDEALEDYATLAATYPKSPLIANVMLRISEHFYQKEDFKVAASVGRKFLERFPTHEWAPKMAFRVGQALYKEEAFAAAAEAFDAFTKQFPDEELTAQGLFWAGESYRMAKDIPSAFQRYNRCRWDFPESEAAKYSRGRLALPELLGEFDRQANLDE